MSEKYYQLVYKIYEKTQSSALKWSEGPYENSFSVDFKSNSIVIYFMRSSNSSSFYCIGVLNKDGEEIETITPASIKDYFKDPSQSVKFFLEIYQLARKQVLGIDNAVDNILKELG